MTHRCCRIVLACSFLFLPAVIQAQEPDAAEKSEERPGQDQVFGLIGSIAARAAMLRSPENRIRVTATVADVLWPQDEKRARALFETVTAEMSAIATGIDRSDSQAYNSFQSFWELRSELIERMARRDPDLALAFLRLTRAPPLSGAPRAYGVNDNEISLEIRLANLVVEKDPERALRIARASLSRGVSFELSGLLSQLQQKDHKSASVFYKEIVDKLNGENLAANQEFANFAVSLLSSFRPPQADEQTFGELIKTVSSTAVSLRPGEDMSGTNFQQNLANQLRHMMTDVEKYAPATAIKLRTLMERFEDIHAPHQKLQRELQTIAQQGTVDDILALAPKYPVEMREQIYQQATWTALNNGDANRARQIASELIADPGQRRNMLEQIERNLMWNAVNAGKFAEARAMLGKFTSAEERAQFLIQLSRNVAAKDDKKTAVNLLEEAETLLNIAAPSSNRMQTQIELADAYSTLDVGRSFAIIGSLVTRLNELIAAAVVLDGFDNRYLKDGEWVTGAGSVGSLVNSVGDKLASLAQLDFDRALALSDQLERSEVRLMVQLQMVQAVSAEASSNCHRCISSPQRRHFITLGSN